MSHSVRPVHLMFATGVSDQRRHTQVQGAKPLPHSTASTYVSAGVCLRRLRRRAHCSGVVEDFLLKPITTAGQNPVLNEGIRTFYDQSSALWEREWGEHMHHGFYDPKSSIKKTNLQAQIDMIEKTIDFAEIADIKSAVDVGCGIGGSSRYLASKFGCNTEGITLSPVQAQRAAEICGPRGLSDRCKYQVGDALQQPFADNSFDLAWSLESGEHMPDKKKFVSELLRVTKPGGKVVIVTWCHRNLLAGEAALKPDEDALLKRISEAYYLPPWCSLADYEAIFEENGVENVKTADWSDNVAPFWGEVVESAVTPSGISGLLTAGWDTLKGAMVMPMMQYGYSTGLIKFVAITGTVVAGAAANGTGSTDGA